MKKINLNLLFTVFFLSILLSSCSSSVTRSEVQNLPALVEIADLDFTQGTMKLRISHRNRIKRESNSISCQLALKDFPPIKLNQIPVPDLTSYATETIDVSLNKEALPDVNQLNKELPYVLDCFLFSENFRNEQVLKKATLYRVPGSTAEYR